MIRPSSGPCRPGDPGGPIADAADAAPMARALIAGGIRTVEITLRTPAALDAIRRIAGEVPESPSGPARS